MNLHVRWKVRRDEPTVLAIEQQCAAPHWSAADFHHVEQRRSVLSFVCENRSEVTFFEDGEERIETGVVVGFMFYELFPTHLHILRLGVERASRRRGVGMKLVGRLVGKLAVGGRTRIVVYVPETAPEVARFFQSLGFRADPWLATEVGSICMVYALAHEQAA